MMISAGLVFSQRPPSYKLHGTQILQMREWSSRDWSYSSGHIDGVLRLISVDDLLSSSTATISLSEWRGLSFSRTGGAFPKYAAISHSWAPSEEVKRLSSKANRPLRIVIEGDKRHEVSWHGLCQAAKAAKHLQCEYLWLDLLCLHQTSDKDKKLQIKNMGNIYEKAKAVVIMPGGVAAAQGPEHYAPWITRAWTLQEASLCPNVYVLILHTAPKPGYAYEISSTSANFSVTNIDGDLAVSPLQNLISGDGGLTIRKTKIGTNVTTDVKFEVNCFGNGPTVVALDGVLSREKPAMRRSAAWRSMWLRTSTKPQDMVFSVMHLLGVEMEVDYSRTRDSLIAELAWKTSSSPSWMDIGESLPFHSPFGLLPELPPFNPNAAPAFNISGRPQSVSNFIDGAAYISKFDIKIKKSSYPFFDGDLICAQIVKIQYRKSGQSWHPYISGNGETYEFAYPDKVKGSHAVVLGERSVYGHAHYGYFAFIGPTVFFIEKSESGSWVRVDYRTEIPHSVLRKARSHVRIGGSDEMTPCNCDGASSSRSGYAGGNSAIPGVSINASVFGFSLFRN